MFKVMAAASAVGKPGLPCKGHLQHGPGEAALAAPDGSAPKGL